MRGITPVIAIILLLLMAVAAAGGFYLVYQSFSASGTESGSTQIEQLGDQSLTQMTIESVAAGKVYVRNVGVSAIDATKLTVYVDNVPVDVNVSTSSIVENGRATLKFTSVPSCAGTKCEVRVSGAATASRSIEQTKLSCASDSECSYGESCSGGVCVVSTTTEGCGNGVCDEGEYGYSCWEDCAVDSISFPYTLMYQNMQLLARYDWDGETYSFHSNITELASMSWDMPSVHYPEDNHAFAVGALFRNTPVENNRCIWYSEYDGSSWSFPANVSENGTTGKYISYSGSDVSDAGNLMVVWKTWHGVSGMNTVTWSDVVNGLASEDVHLPNTNAVGNSPTFAYSQGENGFLFFVNETNYSEKSILYRPWNGNAWGAFSTLHTHYGNNRASGTVVDFAPNGDGTVVWEVNNGTNHKTLHYGSYDGSSWSYTGELGVIEDNETDLTPIDLVYDQHENALLTSALAMGAPPFMTYFRETNGIWGQRFNLTGDPIAYMLPYEHPDGTVYGIYVDIEETLMTGLYNWGWGVWNGTGWSEPVMFNS